MSADNGIYVLKTKRTRVEEPSGAWVQGPVNFVYRIAHAQAIDNFEWYKEKELYNLGAYMKDMWGKSKVYASEEQAILEAHKLQKEIGYTEYGVSQIDASDMVFYGDM